MQRQPELPLDAPAQPRTRRESEQLYSTVRFLRRCGQKVYRAGPSHSVINGRRVANVTLILESQNAVRYL